MSSGRLEDVGQVLKAKKQQSVAMLLEAFSEGRKSRSCRHLCSRGLTVECFGQGFALEKHLGFEDSINAFLFHFLTSSITTSSNSG